MLSQSQRSHIVFTRNSRGIGKSRDRKISGCQGLEGVGNGYDISYVGDEDL